MMMMMSIYDKYFNDDWDESLLLETVVRGVEKLMMITVCNDDDDDDL